jgi:hypothetical protein
MDQKEGIRDAEIDLSRDPGFYRRGDGSGQNRLIWEKPLGTKRGYLDEPGPGFVDVEGEADKEACRWERGQCK